MNKTFAIATVIAATLSLTACDTTNNNSSAETPATTNSLDGNAYTSTDVSGNSLIPGSTLTFQFQGNTISATTGCNNMSGNYTIVYGVLEIAALDTTMTACEPKLMDQEQWLNEFLTNSPELSTTNTTLTMETGNTKIAATKLPGATLEDTLWEVKGTIAGSLISSIPDGAQATLRLSDGTAHIATGCNNASSEVAITDTTLEFGPMRMTRMSCSENLTSLERTVTSVLTGTVNYQLARTTLTIRTAPDNQGTGLLLTWSP